MLYYLSLLTHTDQLAFFRLFRYLTSVRARRW
jgi:hypothetical protein